MRKLIIVIAMSIAALGCTSGYDADPVTPHTPDSIPECFRIARYDDGIKDGKGRGPLGLYCLEK